MERTLRDCLNLLKSDYVSGWSLLLLPALLSLAVVPSSTTTTMALLLRFLGLGVALIPLARVISGWWITSVITSVIATAVS